MPKIPYKPDKSQDDDEDYEIVSFEDFCVKPSGSKTDLLTLNDNINYRLCYESDKGSSVNYDREGSSRDAALSETSLSSGKNVASKRKSSGNFAPFGRYNGNGQRASLFRGVIPKPKSEGEGSGGRDHRYQRFSGRRNVCQRAWDAMPRLGSGVLGIALVFALAVGVWWAIVASLGGEWGEEHYRKLWERAHPDNIKSPLSPISTFEKPIIAEDTRYRYHDHNNLSTKNKNASIDAKKKEPNKKSYSDMTPEQFDEVCMQVHDLMRFDCGPFANQSVCQSRGCCWKPTNLKGAPYCYYPPNYGTFKFVNMSENKHGIRALYASARPSGYPGDFKLAAMEAHYLDDNTMLIKIFDPENRRFEVPLPEVPLVPGTISTPRLRVLVDTQSVGFRIVRTDDNVTIINTQDIGGLILSDKFLQVSAILPTDRVFGFGEHMDSLRRDTEWRTYTIFNNDAPPTRHNHLYGSQPFYMAIERDGKTHGMLLLNSNAMDVVLQPTPALTLRTTGGIIQLVVLAGPSPAEVVSQYTAAVGRPFLPPYWALGFHLCKYGYNTLNNTRHVWKSNRDAGLPFDVQWNDIDYMVNQNDFTYDRERYGGLPQFVNEIHAAGMHYVMILDPGVSASEKPGTYPPYDRGMEMDIFVKNRTGQPFVAKVWNPVSTVYPDFTHPDAQSYWLEMMTDYHSKVNYDGVWLDMNEPSNFLDGPINGSCLPEDLPYKPIWVPDVGLRHKTVCMDAKHHIGLHYDVHSIYNLYEVIATNFALKEIRGGKRPFIISRANAPGLGRYAGHWSGDIQGNWEYMRATIPALLSYSVFGVAMMGADICGFGAGTTPPLCKRWMQLGAFYPFARNHADLESPPQDPASLGDEVLAASISALRLRYALLPYYYTQFWRAHTQGSTVATPLFFLSPEDHHLQDIEDQFLIGEHLMITPIVVEHANTTKAWYPAGYMWYNIRDGAFLGSGSYNHVDDSQMVAVRGGGILPLQAPAPTGPVTTTNSRSRPMQLLAVPDNGNKATGELYWDNGDSINSYEEKKFSKINFTLKSQELTSQIEWWGFGVPSLNNITIFAQGRPVSTVTVNGSPVHFKHTAKTQLLNIYNLNLSLDKPFIVKWTYKTMVLKAKNTLDMKNNTSYWKVNFAQN